MTQCGLPHLLPGGEYKFIAVVSFIISLDEATLVAGNPSPADVLKQNLARMFSVNAPEVTLSIIEKPDTSTRRRLSTGFSNVESHIITSDEDHAQLTLAALTSSSAANLFGYHCTSHG